MNGRTTALLALLIAATPLIAARTEATVVVGMDLADITHDADSIFVGKVISLESRWKDEARKSIETVVTLAVLEPVHGNAAKEVTLRFGGGEVGGLRQVIAGMPQFHPGDEVVLFTTEQPLVSPIVGFHQGCFRVASSQGRRVVLDVDGVPVTGTTARSLSIGRPGDGPATAITLDRFLDTVRRHLGEQEGSTR